MTIVNNFSLPSRYSNVFTGPHFDYIVQNKNQVVYEQLRILSSSRSFG